MSQSENTNFFYIKGRLPYFGISALIRKQEEFFKRSRVYLEGRFVE